MPEGGRRPASAWGSPGAPALGETDIHIPFILFKMNHYLPKLVATATGHVIMHRKPRNMYR